MVTTTTKSRPILFHEWSVDRILAKKKWQTRRPIKMPPHVLRRPEPHEILFYNTGSGQYPGGHPGYTGDQPPGLLVRCGSGAVELGDVTTQRVPCPYGHAGEHVYVREVWWHYKSQYLEMASYRQGDTRTLLPGGETHDTPSKFVDGKPWRAKDYDIWRKRPSIHMPKWASRIWVELTEVRAEQIQDISEEDCIAEGVEGLECHHGPAELTGAGYNCTDCYNTGWIEPPQVSFMELWDETNAHRPEFLWVENPWCWALSFRVLEVSGVRWAA